MMRSPHARTHYGSALRVIERGSRRFHAATIEPRSTDESCGVEDALVRQIDLARALDQLTPVDRALIELIYHYRAPETYIGMWPPTTEEIGTYIGTRFLGYPIGAIAVRRRRRNVERAWRCQRQHPRRQRTGRTCQPSSPAVRADRSGVSR